MKFPIILVFFNVFIQIVCHTDLIASRGSYAYYWLLVIVILLKAHVSNINFKN